MNSLEIKKRAFMSVVTRRYGFIRTKSGAPPLTLTNCLSGNLVDYKISGNVGTNLFDMNLNKNPYIEIHPDENYLDVKKYAYASAMTTNTFLAMTGLKAGDSRKKVIRTRLKRHNFGIFQFVVFERREIIEYFNTAKAEIHLSKSEFGLLFFGYSKAYVCTPSGEVCVQCKT